MTPSRVLAASLIQECIVSILIPGSVFASIHCPCSIWFSQEIILSFLKCALFFKDFIYLFDRERSQVGRETGRERAGRRLPAEQRARCGTQSQDPEIMTQAEGSGLTHWATQASLKCTLFAPNNYEYMARSSDDSLPEQSASYYFSKTELTHIILCQGIRTLCFIKKLEDITQLWHKSSPGI